MENRKWPIDQLTNWQIVEILFTISSSFTYVKKYLPVKPKFTRHKVWVYTSQSESLYVINPQGAKRPKKGRF